MIRGIHFEVPNNWYPVFNFVLSNVDIEKYFWLLAQEDVVGKRGSGGYFAKYRYPGKEFAEVIQNEECYAISVTLQAFPNENDIIRIRSYQDFFKSKCELLLMIDDNEYVNIYVKNIEVLNTIHNNAIINNYENINYITDENDRLNLSY